jgi:glycosyltransferase involved in cell wall biosynthesis
VSSPIRLLLVTKSTGGVASYVRALVRGLDREKFSITVACLSEDSEKFSAELRREFGVQAFGLAMNRYKVDPFSDARVWFQLAKHIRTVRYDLIHAHASKPGFLMRMAALGTNIPVLYSPHNFAFHEGSKKLPAMLVAFLEGLVARCTTRIVAIASHERDLALKYKVGTPALYEVIHTGIDAKLYDIVVDTDGLKQQLGIPPDAPVVGVVGRLAPPKLPLDFVRFAATIRAKLPEAHYIWVGTGPLEAEAKSLTVQLGLKDVIHWLGERRDVPALLQIFDCFVLPSRWEGLPLVVLEAFAAGVPVVATVNLGASELIEDGRTGWLVPVGESQTLAECVYQVLSQPDRAVPVREAARQMVENDFSFDQMISRLTQLYVVEYERAIQN